MLSNLKYLCRSLLRNWPFTAAVIVSLALGTGGTSAVLILLNGILFRPLPYAAGTGVVNLWSSAPTAPQMTLSFADYRDFRTRASSFQGMAAYNVSSGDIVGAQSPENIAGAAVTGNFFDVLDIKPMLGRSFQASDDNQPLIILSYGLWQRDFGARKSVLGEKLLLSGKPYTVVGVMPPTFVHPEPLWERNAEYWRLFPDLAQYSRGFRFLRVIGRLKPGVSLGAATAEMKGIAAQLAQEFPQTDAQKTVVLVPLREQMFGELYKPLFLLLFVSLAVLLIACVNVTNLQFVRSNRRLREISIRLALGANLRNVIFWSLGESLLLVAFGGLGGLILGYLATRVLRLTAPVGLHGLNQTAMDSRMILFTCGLILLSTFIITIPPTIRLRMLRNSSWEHLSGGYRGASAKQQLQNFLLSAQLALVLPLLIATVMLGRSFWSLIHVNLGFEPQQLLSFRVPLPHSRYPSPEAIHSFFRRLLEQTAAIPATRSVAVSSSVPLTATNNEYAVDIFLQPSGPQTAQQVDYHVISDQFFPTMGIPILSGRNFNADDTESSPRVAIINAAFARLHWETSNPLGQILFRRGEQAPIPLTIVGVVGDIRSRSLALPPSPEIYVPFSQDADLGMAMIIRSDGPPENLIAPIRSRVSQLDKELPLTDVQTMDEIIYDSATTQRFALVLLLLSSSLALTLALVGVGGIVAYIVSQRSREFAIRMALGATRHEIVSSLFRRVLTFGAFGIAVGLILALNVSRIPRYLVYGVRPIDLVNFAVAPSLLILIVLLASYIPIRRVLQIDPAASLRVE
jgi:putative ABC transport system permease protein